MTTSAPRGKDREMSLRWCSRAPETTIWLPAGISPSFYEVEQTFGCLDRWGIRTLRGSTRWSAALGVDRRVDLIDQLAAVGELVVLGEVALGILTRLAVQRHVQRHEPGAVEVAALACSCGLRRGGCRGDPLPRRRRLGVEVHVVDRDLRRRQRRRGGL